MTLQKREFTPTKTYTPGSGPKAFRGWALWKADDHFIGILKKQYETVYKGNVQQNYEFLIATANFKAPITKDGKPENLRGKILVINSMGQFNARMKEFEVKVGQCIECKYGGKVADKKDPKTEYHQIAEFGVGEMDESEILGEDNDL